MALFSMFAIFLAFPLSWIFLLAAALGWRDQRQTRVAGTDSRVAADQVDNA
jgi:hypothetical protein